MTPALKRILFPILTILIGAVLLAAGLEAMAAAYQYAITGKYASARERFAGRPNTFIEELTGDRQDCGYVDTLYPHPYLAFVHHGNPPCGISDINNIGLFGPDFPSVRPEDRFVVLLTGGSVASQFAREVGGGPSYLERILNERYVSPTGKPFLVLNGADGAWKQPQQAILLLLYADAVHAVVTLDGFNEHYQMVSSRRFEYPANNFHLVNPLASQSFDLMVARWFAGRLRARAADSSVWSRSHAAYTLISTLEQYVDRRAASQPAARTSIETIFSLPAGWSPEEHKRWATTQYQKYVRAMHAVAAVNGLRDAYFIQPVPALHKPLTAAERGVVGDLAYGPVYSEMAASLTGLKQEQIAVVPLIDLFEGDNRSLYGDAIHLLRNPDGTSEGYRMMAERVATELAALWGLSRPS